MVQFKNRQDTHACSLQMNRLITCLRATQQRNQPPEKPPKPRSSAPDTRPELTDTPPPRHSHPSHTTKLSLPSQTQLVEPTPHCDYSDDKHQATTREPASRGGCATPLPCKSRNPNEKENEKKKAAKTALRREQVNMPR